jgi:hypothetical protein
MRNNFRNKDREERKAVGMNYSKKERIEEKTENRMGDKYEKRQGDGKREKKRVQVEKRETVHFTYPCKPFATAPYSLVATSVRCHRADQPSSALS